jgi:hypothetical protein
LNHSKENLQVYIDILVDEYAKYIWFVKTKVFLSHDLIKSSCILITPRWKHGKVNRKNVAPKM